MLLGLGELPLERFNDLTLSAAHGLHLAPSRAGGSHGSYSIQMEEPHAFAPERLSLAAIHE